MSVFKDGNRPPENYPVPEPHIDAHEIPMKNPKSRAGKALYEGACVDDKEREAAYEKHWKEGEKVGGK